MTKHLQRNNYEKRIKAERVFEHNERHYREYKHSRTLLYISMEKKIKRGDTVVLYSIDQSYMPTSTFHDIITSTHLRDLTS